MYRFQNVSRRPRERFNFPADSWVDNLPCIPCVTARGTHPTYYPEFVMFHGPQTLAVTGDNSFNTLFGREWAFLFCDDLRHFVLQWVGSEDLIAEGLTSPGWKTVTDPLLALPAFDGSERAFTAAFDQSARLLIAYEKSGQILVTRFDTDVGTYVQNVTFAGVDPVLLMDATITRKVPDSDAILFYLTPDRQAVKYRIQRESYGVEHNLVWEDDTPVEFGDGLVLDYAQALFYRFELLIGFVSGAKRPQALLSDLYPIPASDPLAVNAAPGLGEHRQEVRKHEREDTLLVSAAPGVAVFDLTITRASGSEALAADASPGVGAYAETTRRTTQGPETLAADAAPAPGVYDRLIFRDDAGPELLAVNASPGVGEYRAAS